MTGYPWATGDELLAADLNAAIANAAAIAGTIPATGGTMTGPLYVTATGGNTSRSVQDRFGEVVDIHDFGQIGTGNAAIDTATFLAAVAALPANGGLLKIGGVPSSITLNQTITITKSCKILGDTMNGWASSIVCQMSGPAILFSDPTPSYQKTFEVENVRFIGNDPTGPTQSAIQVNVGPTGSQAFPSFVGHNITIAANVASAASPYARTFTRGIEFVPSSTGGAGIHNFWNVVLKDVIFLGTLDSGTGNPIAGTAGIAFGRLICADFHFVHVSQAAAGFHQTDYCEGIACIACQLFSVTNGWDQASFSPEGAGQIKLLQPVMLGCMINAAQSSLALDCVMIGQFSNNYLTGAGASNINLTNAQSTQVCNNYIISGTIGISLTKGSYNEGSNVVAQNVMQNQTTNISLGATTFDLVLDNWTGAGTVPVISNSGTGNTIRGPGNITSGAGAPTATRPVGYLYSRTDGAVGSTLYVSRGGGTWNAVAGV